MGYLLLRQHVSALALGRHQVSNCVSEDTIQCSMQIGHIIQRDLVDNVTIDNCQKKLVYKIKIINYIRTSFFWQISVFTSSRKSRWLIWAICILHCIVSSETQFETWWWPSARAETCFLSNKYSTTLLVVFWLYYLHHLTDEQLTCFKKRDKLTKTWWTA